jgi:hypothetical protein
MPETSPLTVWMTTLIDNQLHGSHKHHQQPHMPLENPTVERWVRYAYLLYCNGGSMSVGSYGVTNHGDFPYKGGLDQDEAFEMMQMSAIINTTSWYEDTFETKFIPLINEKVAYWNEYYRLSKEKAENPAPPETKN